MIIDRLENFEQYHFGPARKRVFAFLDTLTPGSADMKYTIDGDDIFAIVMSYDTAAPETGVFESHRNYVDIQTVIAGGEGFECAFSGDLTVETPYDAFKDAALYKRTSPGQTRVNVFAGTFLMLSPQDAHMAGLIVGKRPEHVKKVVVKIRKELLDIGH